MRNLTILLVVVMCTSCAIQPSEIEKISLKSDQAVVFDIDGTLTPRPVAIHMVREAAPDAVGLYADNGYKIIYLSARPQLLQAGIPGWLKENHFPEGSIHVPQTAEDSNDHAAFKKKILTGYKDNGWRFLAAYGDSSTDFEAYSEVGIKQDRIFALQRAGDTSCQSDSNAWAKCLRSWGEHLGDIELLVQP